MRVATEAEAYALVESALWGDERKCPHCGNAERSGPLQGESTRVGVYKCYACRKPFTVKVGTIFHGSHLPLRHWINAAAMLDEGCSSYVIGRALGISAPKAWRLCKRITGAQTTKGMNVTKTDLPQSQVSRSTSGLREALFEEMDALRSGSSNAQRARSIAMMANSILQSVQVEIEYHKYVSADRDRSIQGQKKVVSLGTDINLGGEKAA